MAGVAYGELALAVAEAGGLGSLACASLTEAKLRSEWAALRAATNKPINLNFFCHVPAPPSPEREARWLGRLAPYYAELGLDAAIPEATTGRAPFDDATSALVCELRPEIVSFHFGLPEERLLAQVKRTGAKVVSSATSVAEAVWLEERGCDAIIAQGYEAGGHRGTFLTEDTEGQVGTLALVPQVADAVKVPVVAAGGIADARGIVAAFALGAAGVQLGTAYLFSPEARLAAPYASALRASRDTSTVLTNVFSGRPARGIRNRLVREVGPISPLAPPFPRASAAVAPLRARSEPLGSADFISMWSGQAAPMCQTMPARERTLTLARDALERFRH